MSTCTKCFVFTEKCQVCELEAKNGELEKNIKIACEALQELDKLKRCALCDRVEIAREALLKIKDA